MASVLSLKEIRTSKSLKEEIRSLQDQIDDLNKQLSHQKKIEAKLREDIVENKKDFDHLEKQFEHFAGLEAEYDELQSQLQMERLEKLIGNDKVEVKSNEELDKAKADLKKVQAELKELKILDPQRLKRQVSDLKKKTQTQANENKSINKALVSTRKELKEITAEKEKLQIEKDALDQCTDFFWQSSDEVWHLYESGQLLKGEDPREERLRRVRCLNANTGAIVLSVELGEDDLAIWLGDPEIPEEVSKEAGKRHKKIAAEAEEDED